eukprot:m.134088 g.134088  ORF g.134088 m.134088 type:complete len:458 (+) comp14687_c0_seq2:139-1512(+)
MASLPSDVTTKGIDDETAVQLLAEYLKFKTVSSTGHKDGSNEACCKWLLDFCSKLGLECEILEGPGAASKELKPIVVAKWTGADPQKPAILLNSHYDVVPVLEQFWKHPAFDGEITEVDGERRIYGRGAQDMKCVGIQYLVGISRLIAQGIMPSSTIYLSYVPDEEVGGSGMAWFLQSEYFKKELDGKLGCVLDEGLANTGNNYTVFYGERTPWWVLVDAKGPTGHGSRFIKGTATHTLHAFTSKALEFRKTQEKELWGESANDQGGCAHAKCKKLGDVSTVNLTMLNAGVSTDGGETYAINVIPTDACAGFDIRVSPTLPHEDMCTYLTNWCREAEVETGAEEGSLSWKFAPYGGEALMKHHTTSTNPKENKYWKILEGICKEEFKTNIDPEIFPAGTDSRFIRALGIPCFGFSPMKNCPILLHEHDEYIPARVFIEGCSVYVPLLTGLTEATKSS